MTTSPNQMYELPVLTRTASNDKVSPPILRIPLTSGIPSRGITTGTCNLYRTYAGNKPLEVLHEFFDLQTTELCGIKSRRGGWTAGKKETKWLPNSKRSLFGSHLFEGVTGDVYLFEGETDAMAMSQVVGADGLCLAYSGKPSEPLLNQWIEFLLICLGDNGRLFLCFDDDPDGKAYTLQMQTLWEGGELQQLMLPVGTKDAAQLLLDGGVVEFKPLIFELPEFLLTGQELITTDGNLGRNFLTTGHKELDFLIGGYAPGAITVLAGPTKSGKSSFTADLVVNFIRNHPGKVLFIPLELNVDQTMQFLAAASFGTHFSAMDEGDMVAERTVLSERILMARHFGFLPIDTLGVLLDCIPHTGVKLVVIDHITAAATSFNEGLTTQLLDAMMSFIQSKLNRFRIPGIIVTHTNASGVGSEILGPGALRGSQCLGQIASTLLGIRRLENGLSEVYTIAPSRSTGKMGRVTFEYDGKYTALNRKTSDL